MLPTESFDYQTLYKREPSKRVFVNRNLRLDKIKFFGFDMDYTLAEYKSPALEEMTFGLVVQRLIDIGYPEQFKKFKYNPIFPVRGLWFDYHYGNLLKVDGFGNILVAVHGFNFLKPNEIEECYPNKFLHLSDKRVFVLNTLFNLPETYLLACLVDYFDNSTDYQKTSDRTGVKSGEVVMSYKSIFQDIRGAVDWVHSSSDMKKNILNNLDKYVVKDSRAVELLTQLRAADRKTFLLTNSEYSYTNGIMSYILGDDWTSYFDITVVDARKPLWFAEGTVFREVNTRTGALNIGIHTGPLRKGVVYSGGSCDAFRRLVKCRGKDVLYIGDHIFGDVLRSKKTRGWKTFLVVPELQHELTVWTGKRTLFERLGDLEVALANLYKDLDSKTKQKPEITDIIGDIRNVTYEMDQEYGIIGSLFRSGSRTTFFATQVERYADIYASSCYNLVHYPTFYFFRAPMNLMSHERTVDHYSTMPDEAKDNIGQKVRGWSQMMSKSGTFCYEEEEEEVSSNSENDSSHDHSGSQSHRSDKKDSHADLRETLNDCDVLVPSEGHVDDQS
ncbi:unnamed protein product [Bursaphelenchus okinawaensis]|uniref:Uncharacterized protein n=1 Tax=Bursaphelenchus okinawaensis TaxID=465554 RepID=A0A811KKX1_9BILA|nr:unnamed protein product [Bursaphelenchus okinawaensis]CAG9104668.1 unnamed protein product [Bursaphelenchus okinawaensis]